MQKKNKMILSVTRVLLMAAAILTASKALADSHESAVFEANKGRIGIITGGVDGTYIQIGSDLSSVLDGVDDLRILTLVGKGSIQNIKDLLYLKGVDIGLVQSDVLIHLQNNLSNDEALKKLAYLTKVYNEEVHILTRKELDVKSVQDLDGRVVNTGGFGSGTQMTSNLLLNMLDLNVIHTRHSNADALEKLTNGEIDAMIFVAGKPTNLLKGISERDGLVLVPVPFVDELKDVYIPTLFNAEDYPGMINDKYIETVAVGAVLAVYDNFGRNTSRYRNLVRFCKNFLLLRKEFLKRPRHPKWKELNLESEVPGWRRFEPMEALLNGQM